MRTLKLMLVSAVAALGVALPAAAQTVSDDINVSLTLEVPNTMAFKVVDDLNIVYEPDIPRDRYFAEVGACIYTNAQRVSTTISSANAPAGNLYQFVTDANGARIGYQTNMLGVFNGETLPLLTKLHNGVPQEFDVLDGPNGPLSMSDDACSDGENLAVQVVFNPILSDMGEGGDVYRIIEDYIDGEGAAGSISLNDTLTITVEPVLISG